MEMDKILNLDQEELELEVRKAAEQVFRLRFQMRMGQNEGVKKLRELKKDIARIKTVERQRELGIATTVTAAPTEAKPKRAAKKALKKAAKTKTRAAKPKGAKPKKAAKKTARKTSSAGGKKAAKTGVRAAKRGRANAKKGGS